MKDEMYQSMYETETYHWYFKSKYEIVLSILEKQGMKKKSGTDIADYGCGCGAMLEYLSEYGTVTGFDFSKEALQYCKRSFQGRLEQVDLENYCEEGRYNYGVALDVIEHIGDDKKALRNIYHAMREDGICVITVPAFMGLWSMHDENCMHKRRYTKKKLTETVAAAGFEIEYISYYNFWFFIPVYFVRKLENLFHFDNTGSRMENSFKDDWLNQLMYRIFSSEKKRMNKGRAFPFGVSLICMARKKGKQY